MADITKLENQLSLVESAIERILEGAQEATMNGKSYREADLQFLTQWAERLEMKIAKNNRKGMVTGYGIPTN